MVRNRWWRYALLSLLTVLLWVGGLGKLDPSGVGPAIAQVSPAPSARAPRSYLEQAQQAYDKGQYAAAIDFLNQAQEQARQQVDPLGEVLALSNLSLAYQQLGQWDLAQTSLDRGFTLLGTQLVDNPTATDVQAQMRDVQGQLFFARGQVNAALETWQQGAIAYEQREDFHRLALNQIYQAQALQALGLYRQVLEQLASVNQVLQDQPTSVLKATALRTLGDIQRVTNHLEAARVSLQSSWEMSRELQRPDLMAAAQLSLGNVWQSDHALAWARGDRSQANMALQSALQAYADAEVQAIAAGNTPLQIQAHLNTLTLFARPEVGQWDAIQQRYPKLQEQITALPPGRFAITAQITLVHTLLALAQAQPALALPWTSSKTGLRQAQAVAEVLEDRRSRSLVLGYLGRIYGLEGDWQAARRVTQQALGLSQAIQADDITYRWQGQLGDILVQQGHRDGAIAAYTGAFKTLNTLRSDLITANPDLQFSFRDSVEPIYRNLVTQLLAPPHELSPHQEPIPLSQDRLELAQAVMEALQIAELENFFQAACIDKTTLTQAVTDEGSQTTAILYPILVGNQVSLILKLPQKQALKHYAAQVSPGEMTQLRIQLNRALVRNIAGIQAVKAQGQLLYQWLLAAAQADLQAAQIETLIFVLDGPLRSIPMTLIHDGSQYLVEHYAIALTLGLEIRDPQPLPPPSQLKVLAASLANPTQPGFAPLPQVNTELMRITDAGKNLGMTVALLQEQSFTAQNFNTAINGNTYDVVHLATHGTFAADRRNTFILAADQRISIDDLGNLFRQEGRTFRPVELLIFSACRTAEGDDRAVLGLAGATVQAGARSAIATLWSVNDRTSVAFTDALYRHLGQPGISRAKALQMAQLALLKANAMPADWAPYILVGSWR